MVLSVSSSSSSTTSSPPIAESSSSVSTTSNPYNTRRKSLYFSPHTHSASVTSAAAPTIIHPTSTKHSQNYPNPPLRSPKRIKRPSVTDQSFTPPPSPPSYLASTEVIQIPNEISSDGYDNEDDPVINAIIYVLQLSNNEPLCARELSSSILTRHLCPLDSLNPSSVVTSRITAHFKRRAAEKPSREPILARWEGEGGRKRTEYCLKIPELISDRSKSFSTPMSRTLIEKEVKVKKEKVGEEKVLRESLPSRLNISTPAIEPRDPFPAWDDEEDDEDPEYDILPPQRSPSRPGLFDPPPGVTLSPHHIDEEFGINTSDSLVSTQVDPTVPAKLWESAMNLGGVAPPLDMLTPPPVKEDTPYVISRSRGESPLEEMGLDSPPSSVDETRGPKLEDDDTQISPDATSTYLHASSAFYDSPLIAHQRAMDSECVDDLADPDIDDIDSDEVRVVKMELSPWENESREGYIWRESTHGNLAASPENMELEELEEWLGAI